MGEIENRKLLENLCVCAFYRIKDNGEGEGEGEDEEEAQGQFIK